MRSRVKQIAVIYPSIGMPQLARGVVDYAREQGNWSVYFDRDIALLSLQRLVGWPGHGVIAEIRTNVEGQRAISLGVPVVNVSGRLRKCGLPRVTVDQTAVGVLAAEHLLACGLHRMAFAGEGGAWFSKQRELGFTRRAAQAGATCQVHVVRTNKRQLHDWQQRTEPLEQWLRGLRPPFGLFAVHDYLGAILMEVAMRIGLRIPADMALVGVDNDRNVCESSPVTISSVARDSWREGYEAAALLDALMSGRKPRNGEVLIPPVEVVCRESTNLLSAVEPRLAAAVEFVRDHIGQPFGVKALEKAAGVSRRWLHTHFKEHFGCTAHEFILRQRIEQAKSMLDQPQHVYFADVAQACGFSDVRHLRAAMRRVEGVTPAEYCRRKRSDGR